MPLIESPANFSRPNRSSRTSTRRFLSEDRQHRGPVATIQGSDNEDVEKLQPVHKHSTRSKIKFAGKSDSTISSDSVETKLAHTGKQTKKSLIRHKTVTSSDTEDDGDKLRLKIYVHGKDNKTGTVIISSESDEDYKQNELGHVMNGEHTERQANKSQIKSGRFNRQSNSSDSDVLVQPKPASPRKEKSRTTEAELRQYSPVTPTKQKRRNKDVENVSKSPSTPSHLLNKLTLISPTKEPLEEKFTPKKLFGDRTVYQSARKALHSTLPTRLPGRESELNDLRSFIKEHLAKKTSSTLYVSGPPGTGKTASLSTVLREPDVASEFKEVYINCTTMKSSGSIFSRIVKELGLKADGKSEKDCLAAIENYLSRSHKMTLLVLDEIDQLESKKQSILYTIFEWPCKRNSKIILIGIANALDLTDRILPRLQARCELKPKLMHFAPYSKQQIIQIFTERLEQAGVLDVFSPIAIQMLSGKVAAVSGDVRRALDIGRRVVELVEQNKKHEILTSLENLDTGIKPIAKSVELKQVVSVLNNVYGTIDSLNDDGDESLPLQQKIILCTLLLMLKKAKNKDITIGKLHDVYRKVCAKRNLLAVDQAEFVGLCSLIETRGILRVAGKKEPRLLKVCLEWDQDEVSAVLRDKQLMSTILQDDSCLGKL